MHLKSLPEGPTHLSHFMQLVSAYEPSEQMVKELAADLELAVKRAAKDKREYIVSQDCLDHFFVVYPSGAIHLCARLRSYEIVKG